jgi:hypothetical protein
MSTEIRVYNTDGTLHKEFLKFDENIVIQAKSEKSIIKDIESNGPYLKLTTYSGHVKQFYNFAYTIIEKD